LKTSYNIPAGFLIVTPNHNSFHKTTVKLRAQKIQWKMAAPFVLLLFEKIIGHKTTSSYRTN